MDINHNIHTLTTPKIYGIYNSMVVDVSNAIHK